MGFAAVVAVTVASQEDAVQYNSDVVKRLNDPALFARGETKVYRDEYLKAVSLPVGGIGAGCIQINGHAQRHAWQIFNKKKN